MSTPLAVAHSNVGLPVRRTSHLAHILFPHADRVAPSARSFVRPDSSPGCLNQGVDVIPDGVGATENTALHT